MIKCITFDLDDTLWEIEPVISKAENQFYEWVKDNYPVVAENFNIEKLRKLLKQTSLENPLIKHDLTKIRIIAYTKLRDLYNLPENMPIEAFQYFMQYRNSVELFDGVEEILDVLKKQYKLGTITNGNASLEKIGIKQYFDFEIKASEAGYMKPSPEIFKSALYEAKCESFELLHVGDSYEKDIIGAMSVNMNYIWLNHNNEKKSDVKVEQIIKSFSELPQALKKLR